MPNTCRSEIFIHEAYGPENVSSIFVVVVLNRLMVDSGKKQFTIGNSEGGELNE